MNHTQNPKTNLVHYVEEVWTELSYEEGISERKITLPIKNRETYQPLPWVKEYRFFDLKKSNQSNLNRLNLSPVIGNQKYNPLYFMDDQPKMMKEHRVEVELAHYIKETWLEINYQTKRITEREILLPIKNRETYQPLPWVKKYNFVDFVKVNIDGNVTVDKTPLNETPIYSNKIIDSTYLNHHPLTVNIDSISPKITNNTAKRKVLIPFEKNSKVAPQKIVPIERAISN